MTAGQKRIPLMREDAETIRDVLSGLTPTSKDFNSVCETLALRCDTLGGHLRQLATIEDSS